MVVYKGIKIPETAMEWEIYSSQPGAAKAAKSMTAAAKRYVNAVLKRRVKMFGLETAGTSLYEVEKEVVRPVFKRLSDFGTFDTEPRGKVAWIGRQILNELGGV